MEVLNMEWIKNLLAKHTKEDGTVDTESFNKEVNTEFAKNAVPKEDFNAKVNELKAANETLATLEKDNKNVESLQQEVSSYKEKVNQLQEEYAATTTKHTVENVLREAGGKDLDYLAYKLGQVEIGEDGKIKDWDSKLKDLQANHANQFESTEDKPKGPDGFTVIPNELEGGKSSNPDVTEQMIAAMNSDIPSK